MKFNAHFCVYLALIFVSVAPGTSLGQSATTPTEPFVFTTSHTGITEYDDIGQAENALRAFNEHTSIFAYSGEDESSDEVLRRIYGPAVNPVSPEYPGPNNYRVELGGVEQEAPSIPAMLQILEDFYAGFTGPGCNSPSATEPAGNWYHGTGPLTPESEPMGPISSIGFKLFKVDYESGPSCTELTAEPFVLWERPVDCPTGYDVRWTGPLTGDGDCHNPETGEIASLNTNYDPPRLCPVKNQSVDEGPFGNPCDPATGAKYQTFTDYVGPGLRFERSWRSNIAWSVAYAGTGNSAAGRMPYGWSHSYSPYVVRDGVTPKALFRPNGTLVPVEELSSHPGRYVTVDASNIQVELVGGDTFEVYLPSGSKEIYGWMGCSQSSIFRLDSIVDAAGRTTSIQYPSACSDRPSGVIGPFGHTLSFVYQPFVGPFTPQYLEKIIDPAGNEIIFGYNSLKLETVTYQDGSQVQYHYDDPDQTYFISGITDEEGIRYSTFDYDYKGRAVSTEHAGGFERWDFVYNPDSTTTATDARGISTVINYQAGVASGRVTGQIVRDGSTKTIANESSGQHRVETITDERGITTKRFYDDYHLTSKIEAFGAIDVSRTTVYEYLDDTSQLLTLKQTPSVCDDGQSRLKEVETVYVLGTQLIDKVIERGFVLNGSGSCDAISRTTSFSQYNQFNQPGLIVGPRTDTYESLSLTYYGCTTGSECGQIQTVTNAAYHVWTFTQYDDHGRPTQVTDPAGRQQNLGYDLRGRLITFNISNGPASRITTIDYKDNGLLGKVTKPSGAFVSYSYNDARLLTDVEDGEGNKITYGYDSAGNRTSEQTRKSGTPLTSYSRTSTYDSRNRVDTILVAGSFTDLDFDAVGNLTGELHPMRYPKINSYDSLNRPDQSTESASVIDFAYDIDDNLISITAPNGAHTSFQYDDFGNLRKEISPDRGTTVYDYDLAGNLTQKTDARGITVSYFYDQINRLMFTSYPDWTLNTAHNYDYGINGVMQLWTTYDAGGTVEYEYDEFGNLANESRSIIMGVQQAVLQVGYEFDEDDQLIQVAYPSGRVVDYQRSALNGRVEKVTTTNGGPIEILVDNISYLPFGPVEGMTYGNGIMFSRMVDQGYRVDSQSATSIQNLDFYLDSAGNISIITDFLDSSQDKTFYYDEMQRLMYETTGLGFDSKFYEYDTNGNRTKRTWFDGPQMTVTDLVYSPNSNRLSMIDGQPVGLDATGNTTADVDTFTYEYNDAGRLHKTLNLGVVEATNTYDGLGQRVMKVSGQLMNQRTGVFQYDPFGHLLAESIYKSGGIKTAHRENVWLEDIPIAQFRQDYHDLGLPTTLRKSFLHPGHLDEPRIATDDNQNIVWRWRSDAFGSNEVDNDPDGDGNDVFVKLRFPGQYWDEESGGLAYNYFRDYDPAIGRYIETDPIGIDGGLNTYGYALQNPLANDDPLGLQTARARPVPPRLPLRLRRHLQREILARTNQQNRRNVPFRLRPDAALIREFLRARNIEINSKKLDSILQNIDQLGRLDFEIPAELRDFLNIFDDLVPASVLSKSCSIHGDAQIRSRP